MTSVFLDFVRVVVDGNIDHVSRRLADTPSLATMSSHEGATRRESAPFFFADIAHYLYAGDTALHMAAAAFLREVAELLVAYGADCRSKNRRGASRFTTHDANCGIPVAGEDPLPPVRRADPNAADALARAPAPGCANAVACGKPGSVDGGAAPSQTNKAGSTPLHLAVQNTGRGGSGSPQAREQQAGIVRLLLERGAQVAAHDGRGRSVQQAATGEEIRALLEGASAG